MKASELIQRGRFREAVEAYRRLTAEAPSDHGLVMALARAQLMAGQRSEGLITLFRLLAMSPDHVDASLELVGDLQRTGDSEGAWGCIDVVTDALLLKEDLARAISALSAFVEGDARVSALTKLVEVCADAGRMEQKRQAQATLVDAYLSEGRAVPARAVAEGLFRSAPDSAAHAARLRRVLEALDVADVDLELSIAAMSVDVEGPQRTENRAFDSVVEVDLSAEVEHLMVDPPVSAGPDEELSDPSLAVELVFANLRKEAGAGRDAGEHAAVLYELGCALEVVGERERALAVFIELQSAQPEFRDVADRIAALTESSRREGAG